MYENILVKCIGSKAGCTWHGKISELKKHRECECAAFKIAKSSIETCSVVMPRKDLSKQVQHDKIAKKTLETKHDLEEGRSANKEKKKKNKNKNRGRNKKKKPARKAGKQVNKKALLVSRRWCSSVWPHPLYPMESLTCYPAIRINKYTP